MVVPTGTANIASVLAALPAARRRAAASPRAAARSRGASHVMLPGVGSVRRGDGAAWSSTGWTARLRDPDRRRPADHRHLRRPSAAVRDQRREPRRARALACVPAMSAASPTTCACRSSAGTRSSPSRGCAAARGRLRLFRQQLPRDRGAGLDGRARPTHGGRFVAAMERGNVLGCQFHPGAVRRLRRGAAGALPGARLMLTSRIIPCLDVSHGRVVKGVRFQGLRDAGDPAERAAALPGHRAATRSSSSTSRRRPRAAATSTRPCAACARCCRSRSPSAAACARSTMRWHLLEAGADKVSVNTAAVERPELLTEIAERFGRQCCVVAIDAARRDGRLRGAGQGRPRGHRHRRDRLGARGRAARRRRDPADLLGPRRHALGLRPGADPARWPRRCACR